MITYVFDTTRTAIKTSILVEDRQEETGSRWLFCRCSWAVETAIALAVSVVLYPTTNDNHPPWSINQKCRFILAVRTTVRSSLAAFVMIAMGALQLAVAGWTDLLLMH
jgi:hypothetical protein